MKRHVINFSLNFNAEDSEEAFEFGQRLCNTVNNFYDVDCMIDSIYAVDWAQMNQSIAEDIELLRNKYIEKYSKNYNKKFLNFYGD